MLRTRVAAVVFGAAIAVGGAAATAVAQPSGSSNSSSETHVPTTGGPVTINVAGVGMVAFTVDATTGAITDVVVIPVDGVTVGTPVVAAEGVKIQVTASDGTISVLEISAKHDGSGLEVETEVEVGDGTDNGGGNKSGSGDNRGNGDQSGSGSHSGSGDSSGGSGGDQRGGGPSSGGDQSGGGQSGGSD